MQARLHLISMPWANPELPSIQTAVLKAHIDAVFGKRIVTKTYSAFANILLEQTNRGYEDYFEKYQEFEEYPYFVMYCRQMLRTTPRFHRISLDRLMRRMNEGAEEPLTLRGIAHLERRTRRYIESTIVPQLSRRALNVVGFTLNYYQLHASIYCLRYLRDHFPDYDYLFVFGGAVVSYPKVAEVLQRLGIEGLCVIGEGEGKLELILREILATPVQQRPEMIERLAALHDGIYDIQNRTLNLYEADSASLLDLQIPLERLPLPDLDEYYSSLRKVFTDDQQHDRYRAETWLAMEGTRGCFAKCDFCDVHTSWSGFRKSTPERIVANLLELARRHRTARVKFMDNVCDTWAEKYADLLIESKVRITSFMECRVHHPEVFWTKLSLSGVELVQVGIEALSPSLLRAMNKGTRAKQNLLVQKWLKELGVESLSNLISHHPKSNVQQVRETRDIIGLIPHLDRLDFSNLSLQIGTPLDRRLTPDERRQLSERQPFELPKSLDQFFVLKGEYEPPDAWYGAGVSKAWDELIEWEENFSKRCRKHAFMSSIRCGPDETIIRDGRFGTVEDHYLEGDTARVHQLCHQGATLEALSREMQLPPARVQRIVSRLIDRQLLAELEGFYIALALRPRDELIHNYLATAVNGRPAPRVIQELAVLA